MVGGTQINRSGVRCLVADGHPVMLRAIEAVLMNEAEAVRCAAKSGETLSFLATDIEIQIVSRSALEQTGDTKGITVGARKLVEILRALPDGEVTLSTQDKRLQVKSGRSRFTLQTLPAEGRGEVFLPSAF